MILDKWNTDTKRYERHEVPDSWNIKTYSSNMEEIINCASCGKEIKVGEGYISLEIHTSIGFGYSVCQECYREEAKRKYGR